MPFGLSSAILNVIIHAKFHVDRLRGFWAAGPPKVPFSILTGTTLTTVLHYHADCDVHIICLTVKVKFGFFYRLQPNVGFILWRVLVVFTHWAITPLKVNRFGWNLEYSVYIVGGWPWQILGAIHAVATVGDPGGIFSCKQCTISFRPNSTKFEHNSSISVTVKTFGTEFRKFYYKGRLKNVKIYEKKNV